MAVSDAQLEALIKSLEKLAAAQGGSPASGPGGRAPRTVEGTPGDFASSKEQAEASRKATEDEVRVLANKKRAMGELAPEEEAYLKRKREELEILKQMAGARSWEVYEKQRVALQDLAEAQVDAAKAQAKLNQQFELGQAKAGHLANSFLSIGGAAEDLTRVIPLTAAEFDGWATSTIDSIASGEAFFNVFKKIAAESFNLAMATDSSAASFRRMTGAADDGAMGAYGKVISNTRDQVAVFGAGHKEVAAAMGALYDGYSDFTTLSEDQKTAITAQTVALDALGVSSQTSGQIFDRATKSLGFNESELVGLTETLHATAQSLGKSTKAVFEDFNQVSKQLAFYGKDVVEVFQHLEKQSKATGLSTSELVAISGKAFDTFDGAAKKVGKLNAILGGPYLNSIDMLNASEAERIDMLKQSMDMAGQTYSELNKFEQLAIADALGVDVDTARRMFGELSAAEEMEIRNQEKIAETAREAQAVMDKLKNAFYSLITAMDVMLTPFAKIVEGFSWLIGLLNDTPEGFQKFVRGGITAVATLAALTMAVIKFQQARQGVANRGGVRGMLGNLRDRILGRPPGGPPGGPGPAPGPAPPAPPIPGPPAPDTTSRWESFTEGIKQLGEAVKDTWKEMLAFGAAILMIGGGIAIAALGLSKLVESFQVLTGGQIVGAVLAIGLVMGGFVAILYFMIPAIVALGAAATPVSIPLIALGVAFLLMGAGIALAAYGLSLLVGAFGLFIEKLSEIPPVLMFQLALSLYALSGSLIVLGVGLVAAGIGAAFALIPLLLITGPLLGIAMAAVVMGLGMMIAAKGMALFMNAALTIPPDKMMELAMAVGRLGIAMLTLAGGLLLASIGFVAMAGALLISLPMIALSIIPLFLWSLALKAVGAALMVIGLGMQMLTTNMLLIPPAFVIELGGAFGILGGNLIKLAGGLISAAYGFGVLALSLLFAAPILGLAAIPIAVLGMALMILGTGMLLVGSGMDKMAASMSIMADGLPGLVLLGAALGDMAKGLGLFAAALLFLNVKKLQALAEFNNSLITPEAVIEGTITAKPITPEPVKEGTFAAKPAGTAAADTNAAPGGAAAADISRR